MLPEYPTNATCLSLDRADVTWYFSPFFENSYPTTNLVLRTSLLAVPVNLYPAMSAGTALRAVVPSTSKNLNPLNALLPMVATVLAMVTDLRPVQP